MVCVSLTLAELMAFDIRENLMRIKKDILQMKCSLKYVYVCK